jgi:hypothetical protein
MKNIFSKGSPVLLRLTLASILIAIALAPVCQAQSADTPNLDKHARKIHKQVARYPAGTYVSIVLRDGSESAGALGVVRPVSFTFNNSDSNTPETHSYADVARIERGREYIGAGSGPEHHVHWIRWSVVGVAAAGAAVTAFAVR